MRFRDRERNAWDRNPDEGEIRVTDRRRRYLNDDATNTAPTDAPEPNLKPSYVEELEKRTKAAEQLALDVQSRFEQLRRKLQQETDETRQRLNRAADERTERSKAEFIASLVPVLDNLERAIEAADNENSTNQLLAGIEQTAETFRNALRAAGVEPLNALGELFDPELHEAVETVPVEPEQDGRVVTVYTPGYRMGDRLLRPARVGVGRVTEIAQTANEQSN